MPLMVPMWITIPDPNNPRRKKFFALSFFVRNLIDQPFYPLHSTNYFVGVSDVWRYIIHKNT